MAWNNDLDSKAAKRTGLCGGYTSVEFPTKPCIVAIAAWELALEFRVSWNDKNKPLPGVDRTTGGKSVSNKILVETEKSD